MIADNREDGGKLVRAAWIAWAKRQPDPKASWLVPWEELSESDKEADRCIWDAIAEPYRREKHAVEAAEEHTIIQFTNLSRHTIKENWQLEPEEFAKLEFNADGSSLSCGIASSQIEKHVTEPEEYWTIVVYPDIGIEVDPERWMVYQTPNGDWIVEE